MAGIREQGRAENTARILASARSQIAQQGAAGLSMRAVARDVGMVSSAVFRYFPNREALLTELIIESYGHLAGAVEQAVAEVDGGPAQVWRAAALAARDWARAFPHEFQLIYGTPVPDYQAPPQTIPAAARVAAPFLDISATGAVAELAQVIGFISLELAGHFRGVVDDTDAFFREVVERQVSTLGLD
ncbi:TetR/AcrR family transcriptional regulator [Propionibacteriaceae bacterium Y1923]